MKAVTLSVGKTSWSVFLCANDKQLFAAFVRAGKPHPEAYLKSDGWLAIEPDYAGIIDLTNKAIFIPIRKDQYFVFRAIMYRLAEAAIYELIASGVSAVELGRLMGQLASQFDKNFWLDLMSNNREAKV